MKVKFKIIGYLKEQINLNKRGGELELENDTTVGEALNIIGIENKQPIKILVDTKPVTEKFRLYQGAEITLIPIVGGG